MINAQYSISKGWKLFFQGLELSRAPPSFCVLCGKKSQKHLNQFTGE